MFHNRRKEEKNTNSDNPLKEIPLPCNNNFKNKYSLEEDIRLFKELNKFKNEFRTALLTHPCVIERIFEHISKAKRPCYFTDNAKDIEQKKRLKCAIPLVQKYIEQNRAYEKIFSNHNLSEAEKKHFEETKNKNYKAISELFSKINWNSVFLNKLVKELSGELQDQKCLNAFTRYTELHKQILKKNLPIVYLCAHEFTKDRDKIEDAIQNGVIGLSRAIDSYDFNKQLKFITLLRFHVRGAIRDYDDMMSSFGMIPFKMVSIKRKIDKIISDNPCVSNKEISEQVFFQGENISEKTAQALKIFSIQTYEDLLPNNRVNQSEKTDCILATPGLSEALSPLVYSLLYDYYYENKTQEELTKKYHICTEKVMFYLNDGKETIREYINTLSSDDFIKKENAIRRGFSATEFSEYIKIFNLLDRKILNARFKFDGSLKEPWYELRKRLHLKLPPMFRSYAECVSILDDILKNRLEPRDR